MKQNTYQLLEVQNTSFVEVHLDADDLKFFPNIVLFFALEIEFFLQWFIISRRRRDRLCPCFRCILQSHFVVGAHCVLHYGRAYYNTLYFICEMNVNQDYYAKYSQADVQAQQQQQQQAVMEPEKTSSLLVTDTGDRLSEARKILHQLNSLSDDSVPSFLAPYKRALETLSQKKDVDGNYVLDRYSKGKLLKKITKKEFKELSSEFSKLASQKANLSEFLNLFFQIIKLPKDPISHLGAMVGLLDLFNEISGRKKRPFVTWPEISTAILGNFTEETHISEFGIANKYVYKSDTLKRALSPRAMSEVYCFFTQLQLRPEIVGKVEAKVALFRPNHKLSDNQKHPNGIRTVKYMVSINKILCLDQVSELFYVYQCTGKLWKKIRTSLKDHPQGSRIMSINWSEYEQRIGACMQDKSLSFWDWVDTFGYEHSFKHDPNYTYINIWYVEYCKTWITLDSNNVLHKWDIYQETSKKFPKGHDQIITDLVEIPTLPAVIASSLDKRVIIWDVKEIRMVMSLTLPTVSAHTLVYSNTFEVMFSAGFECEICMWTFAKALDITLSKRLPGHNAQITALQIMDPQHILLSADEIGYIKSWDVLTLTCMQSFYFESRVALSKALCINEDRFIVVGNRFYFFEFEGKEFKGGNKEAKKKAKKEKLGIMSEVNTIVTDVEYSEKKNMLYIATSKDIRAFDAKLGKCLKVYAGIVSEDEEISKFALTAGQEKFAIADTAGNIHWVSIADGIVEKTKSGSGSVLELHLDSTSGLLANITKSHVYIQTDERLIREMHGKSAELELATVSESLNLIAALTRNGLVYIWDYCNFKTLGVLDAKVVDILSLKFLEPYLFLLTLHGNGPIVIWDATGTQRNCFGFYSPIYSIVVPNINLCVVAMMENSESREDATVLLGSEEGILVKAKLNLTGKGYEPVKDKRKMQAHFAGRSLKGELPTGEPAFDHPLTELNTEKLEQLDINKEITKVQAHNEPINMIKLIKIGGIVMVVTKGDNQTLKMWKDRGNEMELVGAIHVEGAVPYVWDIDAQDCSDRVSKVIKAAACLYQLNKGDFDAVVNSEYSGSSTFTTEVPENAQNKTKKVVLYKQLLRTENKSNGESAYEVMSFRQLDIRKSRLQDENLSKLSSTHNLQKSEQQKRTDPRQNTLLRNESTAMPSTKGEDLARENDAKRELTPPTFEADITRYKLLEEMKTMCYGSEFMNPTEDKALSLPAIRSTGNLNEPKSIQKGVRKSKKNWLEYAKEKEDKKILPLIFTKEENKTRKSLNRKQLLAQMLEKKKKSMVSRYSVTLSSELSTTRMPSDSKELAKELDSLLKGQFIAIHTTMRTIITPLRNAYTTQQSYLLAYDNICSSPNFFILLVYYFQRAYVVFSILNRTFETRQCPAFKQQKHVFSTFDSSFLIIRYNKAILSTRQNTLVVRNQKRGSNVSKKTYISQQMRILFQQGEQVLRFKAEKVSLMGQNTVAQTYSIWTEPLTKYRCNIVWLFTNIDKNSINSIAMKPRLCDKNSQSIIIQISCYLFFTLWVKAATLPLASKYHVPCLQPMLSLQGRNYNPFENLRKLASQVNRHKGIGLQLFFRLHQLPCSFLVFLKFIATVERKDLYNM
eukprot:TRINITY_DN1875_c0_g1_i1.p1 TRINITY_DN1875_c0_g1~~TRINITY_DN1875_c0_g1_i1.p1  ORF type:complete len:1605 (-),score=125.67 TRINITY_DN1875_c0_g1_i1:9223-14037(-)